MKLFLRISRLLFRFHAMRNCSIAFIWSLLIALCFTSIFPWLSRRNFQTAFCRIILKREPLTLQSANVGFGVACHQFLGRLGVKASYRSAQDHRFAAAVGELNIAILSQWLFRVRAGLHFQRYMTHPCLRLRENLRRVGERFAGSLALIIFNALAVSHCLRPHHFPRAKKRSHRLEVVHLSVLSFGDVSFLRRNKQRSKEVLALETGSFSNLVPRFIYRDEL